MKTTKKAKVGRPEDGLGPTFSCRLTKEQHEAVAKIKAETGANYAEIVRRHLNLKKSVK